MWAQPATAIIQKEKESEHFSGRLEICFECKLKKTEQMSRWRWWKEQAAPLWSVAARFRLSSLYIGAAGFTDTVVLPCAVSQSIRQRDWLSASWRCEGLPHTERCFWGFLIDACETWFIAWFKISEKQISVPFGGSLDKEPRRRKKEFCLQPSVNQASTYSLALVLMATSHGLHPETPGKQEFDHDSSYLWKNEQNLHLCLQANWTTGWLQNNSQI